MLARVGLRAGNDMAEVGRGMADLGDREARLAFLDTLRAVVGPGGQRVSALDRLYLAADLPLLIVWGDCDPIIPVGHGRRAHEAVPGSEMLEIAGAGHFPQLDDPAGFVTAVNRFIAAREPWSYDPARVRELMLAGSGRSVGSSRWRESPSTPRTPTSSAGARTATARPSDGVLEVDLRRPKEMGGEGDGTNPEQLFAVGYAACFESALGAVARRQKLEVDDVAIDSSVSLIPTEERGFKLGVELDVTLPSVTDSEQAVALVRAAHERLPVLQRHPRQRRRAPDGQRRRGRARVSQDDDDWVGTPPEGHYTRDRAKPEFWRSQRPPALIAGLIGIVVLILIIVILLG